MTRPFLGLLLLLPAVGHDAPARGAGDLPESHVVVGVGETVAITMRTKRPLKLVCFVDRSALRGDYKKERQGELLLTGVLAEDEARVDLTDIDGKNERVKVTICHIARVAVGATLDLELPGNGRIQNVALVNRSVARAKLSGPRTLRIDGLRAGTTGLTITGRAARPERHLIGVHAIDLQLAVGERKRWPIRGNRRIDSITTPHSKVVEVVPPRGNERSFEVVGKAPGVMPIQITGAEGRSATVAVEVIPAKRGRAAP